LNIVYRKAIAEDADTLSGLRVQMLFDHVDLTDNIQDAIYKNTKEYFLSSLKDGHFAMCVAEDGDRIIAMGGISYFRIPPNNWCIMGTTAHIGNMFTLPDYRKNGIANKILSLLMDEAKEKGVERVILVPTAAGKPVYEKYGFEPWTDAMAYYLKKQV